MTSTQPAASRASDGGWTFEGFGEEFDGHVVQHLPGYDDVQRLIAHAAQYLVPDHGVVADYGASTGRTAQELLEVSPGRRRTFHLYDNDQSMLDQARLRVPSANLHLLDLGTPRVAPSHSDADLSLALWLFQFLHPKLHRNVLQTIRAGAGPDSALIIATKTQHRDSRWENISIGALDDHKASQGVSAEDRAVKTRALRGSMFPMDLDRLREDLLATGWESPTTLWRWHVWTVVGTFAVPSWSVGVK